MKTLLALGSTIFLISFASTQERQPQEQKPTPTPTAATSRKSFFESRSNTVKSMKPTVTATAKAPTPKDDAGRKATPTPDPKR